MTCRPVTADGDSGSVPPTPVTPEQECHRCRRTGPLSPSAVTIFDQQLRGVFASSVGGVTAFHFLWMNEKKAAKSYARAREENLHARARVGKPGGKQIHPGRGGSADTAVTWAYRDDPCLEGGVEWRADYGSRGGGG